MLAIINALLIGFLWGIRRGASSCLALCIPSIIPTLVEERGDWKGGLKIALWFNIPRIFFLTLLGMVIGAGGYVIREGVEEFTAGSVIWSIGYGIIGCMMIIYGTYIFATKSEDLDDPDNIYNDNCGSNMNHPLLSKFNFMVPTTKLGLLLWGGLVSIACIGETVLAIETIFVGIFTSGAATSPAFGALLGGLAFFIFAIGTAIPSMLIASFSTTLADREKRRERLLQIEIISGILMILFGVILALTALFVI